MGNLHVQVNERAVDWDDEGPIRQTKKCKGCGSDTKGRADLNSPERSFANLPYCMTCAANLVLDR